MYIPTHPLHLLISGIEIQVNAMGKHRQKIHASFVRRRCLICVADKSTDPLGSGVWEFILPPSYNPPSTAGRKRRLSWVCPSPHPQPVQAWGRAGWPISKHLIETVGPRPAAGAAEPGPTVSIKCFDSHLIETVGPRPAAGAAEPGPTVSIKC